MKNIIGIDMGGTNVRGGWVSGESISHLQQQKIAAQASEQDVLQQLFRFTDGLMDASVQGIGIGVPGMVDAAGVVHDVVNIPFWKQIPLQQLMEERYRVPVVINNDANCFALGEFHFGQGKGAMHMVGLTIGTGLGGGVIIHKKLYAGATCGAGEFGMMPYLNQCYEYYASGQFFQNVYHLPGDQVYNRAVAGDATALRMYAEMGGHLGNAIQAILFAVDVPLFILGGSVRKAFPYFSKAMWESIDRFPFQRAVKGLQIKVSALENSGILGAAALLIDAAKD